MDYFVELVHAIVDKKVVQLVVHSKHDMQSMRKNIVELRKENSFVGNYPGHES